MWSGWVTEVLGGCASVAHCSGHGTEWCPQRTCPGSSDTASKALGISKNVCVTFKISRAGILVLWSQGWKKAFVLSK